MAEKPAGISRREWLSSVLMWFGLFISYTVFAVEGLSFILPKRLKPRTRKLFAGPINQYEVDSVKSFYDPAGNEILVKRGKSGFSAFSSTCPHLGCRIRWEAENNRFFCPCHNGVFDADGNAIEGPPADGNQDLYPVSLEVDEAGGVVYVHIKASKRGTA